MKNLCNNWDLKDYQYINFAPSSYYGEDNRAWQGCPTIAITKKGRLFAGWYSGGAFEPCLLNYNILVMSDDKGKTWSSPILTVESDKKNKIRYIDVELWINKDNSLWVMWTVSPCTENSKTATIKTPFECDYHQEFSHTEVMVCKNPDADELVWEKPRKMCEGFMRNKPIVTSQGRIIAPAYGYSSDKYQIRCSDDGGKTFFTVEIEGKPDINVFDEIMVCERLPSKLRMLTRTNKGYYLYSDSFDDGNTWSEMKEYSKAPSSRCYYGKLKNGMIIHARNVSIDKREGLKVCLSEDGGESFPYEMIIDDRELISYPDIDEDENGNIYIVYDRERDNRIKLNKENWTSEAAKEILLCKLTIDDIKNNNVSQSSFVRKIISKARINEVNE